MWELEERHLQEKHQQLKQQLKDQYFMQRHQLLKRHEKVGPETHSCSHERVPYELVPWLWFTRTCTCDKSTF